MVSSKKAGTNAGDQIRAKGFKAKDVLGPYDVVVEVYAKGITELFEQRITPINLLPEIGACTTYLAVDERTREDTKEEPFAYILMDVSQPELIITRNKIFEDHREIQKADIVLGPFDIVAEVGVHSIQELAQLFRDLTKNPGILRTVTLTTFSY